MTEQIKAWAVSNLNEPFFILYDKQEDALETTKRYDKVGIDYYEIIELTSTPKIKMTQAEWDEFKLIKKEYEDESYTIFGVLNGLNNSFSHCVWPKLLFNSDLPTKERDKHMEHFIKLLTSDNPEELVEIEEEKRFNLASKLVPSMIFWKTTNGWHTGNMAFRDDERYTLTQNQIAKLGGDDFLNEMGLEKKEVTE